jgi:hypothetical protein
MGKHTIATLPDEPYRHIVTIVLREELGKDEETAFLVDWVESMWETIDTLLAHFDEKDVQKIILARSALPHFV